MQTIDILFRVWKRDGKSISEEQFSGAFSVSDFGVPVDGFDEVGRAITARFGTFSSESDGEQDDHFAQSIESCLSVVSQVLDKFDRQQVVHCRNLGAEVDLFINISSSSSDVIDLSFPSNLLAVLGRLDISLAMYSEST